MEHFTATESHITQVSNIDLRASKQLKSLNLSRNDIQELTPYIFGWALQLQSIDLSFNQISEIAENAFDKGIVQYEDEDNDYNDGYNRRRTTTTRPTNTLRHLDIRMLHLNNNKLSVFRNAWFKTLINLEDLNLDGNLFKAIDFNNAFIHNQYLRVLHVGRNYLEDIQNFSPQSFPVLNEVDLSHNPLVNSWNAQININIINISNMTADKCRIGFKTWSFDASFNNIKDVIIDRHGEDGLIQEVRLRHLNLAHNQIGSVANITNLPHLITLNLGNNLLDTIPAGSFSGLPNLEYLYLDHNKLQHIEYEFMNGMELLASLQLSYNNLEKFQIKSKQNNLQSVELNGNKISSIDLDLRRKAPHLRTIYAGNNDWNCNVLTTAILVLNTDDIRLLASSDVTMIDNTGFDSSVKGIGCNGAQTPQVLDDHLDRPRMSVELREKLETMMDQRIHEFETRLLDVITNITNQNMQAMVAKLDALNLNTPLNTPKTE